MNSGSMGLFTPTVPKLLLANFLYFFPKLLAPFAVNSFLDRYWFNDASDVFIAFIVVIGIPFPTSLMETALYQTTILLFNILATYLLACIFVFLASKLKGRKAK